MTQTTVEDQVRDALELIRPAIQLDGGDVRLESVRGTTATVQLLGVCETCPISPVTLRHGVERIIRERVPEITEVIAVEA
ncbi:MAG TPA: NifU family protein [Actinomycetota bacterium]|nr:NifU family protein [Actinomycetota bacterium]